MKTRDDSNRVEGPGCKVRDGGMAHLFTPLELGARCACGRAVIVEDEDGRLTMREDDRSDAA